MLKRLLTGFAALIVAVGIAGAANLSLVTGPQDPSQLTAVINNLIRSINTGVSGRIYANVTAAGTTTTVGETVLMTYSLPANTLATTGDAVRIVCWGTSPANANVKAAVLYFGSQIISTTTMMSAPNNKVWALEMLATRNTAATQNIIARGTIDLTAPNAYSLSGSETLTSAVTIKCNGYSPTARADITAQGMYIEQVK